MAIDTQTVVKIAKLARLNIAEGELEHYAGEMSGILQWIEQLGEVDTQGVPQMVSVCPVHLPWRKDEVTEGGAQQAVLANAPASEYGCFTVPKVIE